MARNEMGLHAEHQRGSVLSQEKQKGELPLEEEGSRSWTVDSKRDRRTQVTTTYNEAAKKILDRDQPALEDRRWKDTTLSTGTVMGVIKALQSKHHEGKLTTEKYREGIDMILSSKHPDLEQKLRELHPQLFSGMDLAPPNAPKSSDEEMHEQLHTRHVLPVVTPRGDETLGDVADTTKQTSVEGRPIRTWADLYVCADACYRKAPLQFPLAIVCVMSLRYKELFEDLSRVKKSAGLLDCDADSPMRRMLKGFTKVICSMLKDQAAPWLKDESPEFLEIVEDLRKAMKATFHRADQTTCHFVAKGLSRIGRMLGYIETHDSERNACTIVRAFFQRLFLKLAVNESMQLCEAARIISSLWLPPRESEESETTTIHLSATQKCERCSKDLTGLCIVNVAEFICPPCWISLDSSLLDRNQCIPLMLSSGTTTSDPLIPSSHLMAHQLNMWQSKPGTRHATLADQRRAILTTSQQEVRTVQGLVSPENQDENSPPGRILTQHIVWPGSQEEYAKTAKDMKNLVDLDVEDPSPMKRISHSREEISDDGPDKSPLDTMDSKLMDDEDGTPTPGSGFDSGGEVLADAPIHAPNPVAEEHPSGGKAVGKKEKVAGSSRNEFAKSASCVYTPKPASAEKRAGYSKTITAPIPPISQKKVLDINQRKPFVGGGPAKPSSQTGTHRSPPTSCESSAHNGDLSGTRRCTLPSTRRAKTMGQKDSSASLSPLKRGGGVDPDSTLTAGVDDPLILRLLNSTPKRGQGVVRR